MLSLHTDLICSLLDARSEELIKQERSTASFKIIKEEISLILSFPPPFRKKNAFSHSANSKLCICCPHFSLTSLNDQVNHFKGSVMPLLHNLSTGEGIAMFFCVMDLGGMGNNTKLAICTI